MRQHHGMDHGDIVSIRSSFHQSLTLLHRATHPYIVRLMGMIGPTGAIILEKAAGGSLADYLRRKCIEMHKESKNGDKQEFESMDDRIGFVNVD